jgi:hypothetical protein
MGAETYKRIKVSALGSAPSVMTNTEVDRAITRSPILFQTFRVIAVLLVIPPIVASCASHQIGPYRAIPIESDVEAVRSLAYPSNLANSDPGARNDMLTARIYMSDMEYQVYEANLTKEMQDEGLLGTAAVLGLTTSSTLVGAVATKTILSGIATGVTGLDKAYNEKELLSNAMQALQTQMRADRNAEAAQIYAKMFRDAGNIRKPTPISEYTMAMALSDAEAYYQAGTITSALIGLSRTAARADANAAMAKANAGPNPSQVAAAQETAAPTSGSDIPPPPPPPIIIKASSQVPVITPPPPVIGAGNPTEKQLGPAFVTKVQNLLCVSGTKGAWDGPTHDAIKAFFAGVDGVPWSDGGITPGSANPHSDLSEKGITLGDAGDLTHASSILAANPQLGSCKDLKGPELDNWRRKLGGKL